MPIAIESYREEHQNAVRAFNQRLRDRTSESDLVFYEHCHPAWLPKLDGSPLYNEYFVAQENDAVHGAYALKYEQFFSPEQGEFAVACYHHPLSEGVIDRNYFSVGGLLLRDAVRRESMLYTLGMGGYDRPLPKMLKAMGWELRSVPFYFHVVHPYRFLRQMMVLRISFLQRWMMNLAAFSGIGWAALAAWQKIKRLRVSSRLGALEAGEVEEFADWADTLWLEAKDAYHLASVRDCQTLARLYPPSQTHLTKLCVYQQGRPIGWAVVGERRTDPKYGSLRVGSIVDCWAHPANATQIIYCATLKLEANGVNLIVSNQSHKQWRRALEECGFFTAESNFVFATSKKFSGLLQKGDFGQFHLNRANGDGLPANF
jgi:hypothetical protein